MPFFNTKDAGPMVLEIPPADDGVINGTIMDAWAGAAGGCRSGWRRQRQGREIPDPAARPPRRGTEGLHCSPVGDYQGYALLRSILRSGSDADVAKAVDYAKCIKLYPLSQAANPPATTFVDAINSVYDSTIPYDLRFFQSLDRIVQTEPWLPRDKLMIDMLKSIGIEKGKPFSPDAKSQDILNSAAREAHALLESRYDGIFTAAGRSRRCPTISRLLRMASPIQTSIPSTVAVLFSLSPSSRPSISGKASSI